MRNKKHFTLVEIMIVVAIIGLLAAIAIPSFMKARATSQKNACINNLRQIDAAVQQWAIETNQTTAAVPAAGDITPYIKGGAVPTCPGGGTITLPATVAATPTCDQPGHVIP